MKVALIACAWAFVACNMGPPEPIPPGPQMVVVTPANVTGEGIPKGWALVRNGRGLTYWAAPEVWKTFERE